MKMRVTLAALALLACLGSAAAQSPEKQYGFAEHLRGDVDDVLALLEFKRFAYLYPDHQKAPNALMQAARIRLLHTREVGKAERTLNRIAERYPDSDVAQAAAAMKDFVAANSDYKGEPLARYLRARQAAEQGKHAKALELYNSIPETWDDAQLADDAMLAAAKVHLQDISEPKKARGKLDALLQRYPKRDAVAEAMYRRAEAVLEIQGAGGAAMEAYQKVIDEHPDSSFAEEARRRIQELKEEGSFVKRTYDEELVRDYEVVSSGYEDGNRLVEKIELSSSPSRDQVRATLEDALIKAVGKRRNDGDAVTVEAYYTYPVTEAGEANWQPGQDPEYGLEERDAEDRVKDTLFDILRGR